MSLYIANTYYITIILKSSWIKKIEDRYRYLLFFDKNILFFDKTDLSYRIYGYSFARLTSAYLLNDRVFIAADESFGAFRILDISEGEFS